MDRLRGVTLAGCGILLASAGVLVSAPGLLGPLGPTLERAIAPGLTNSGLTLVVVGFATAIISVAIASGAADTGSIHTDVDSVLGGVDSTVAGSTFDRRIEQLSDAASVDDSGEFAGGLRDEVERTAVTVLARRRGLSTSEARSRIHDGSWTTDPQAAAFLSRFPPPLLVRLREWLAPNSIVQQRLERVLTELEAEMELDAGQGRTSGGSSPADTPSVEDAPIPGPQDEFGRAVRHRVDDDPEGATPDDRVVNSVRVSIDAGDQSAAHSESVVGFRRFGMAVGLVAVAVGLTTNVTTAFLLGLLGVGYSLTKYVASAPPPLVEVTRVLASDSPVPGDLVEVELSVENVSERPVPDFRAIDGTPDALRIVEGSPSMATSLQPGGTASVRYVVRAKRGTFTFAETQLITRDLSNVREQSVEVTVPTRLTGATQLEDLALRERASKRIGAVKTDRGGSGVEFYGTREYREGDPLSRVNWHQLAKTGELSTVEFREQRAPTVAIVLDQRDASRLAPRSAALDGVDLAVYAAEQTFLTLLDVGTEVGLITYGERLTDVEPASDATQRALVQSRLRAATDRYAAALGEATIEAAGTVHQRLSPEPEMLDHHVPRNARVLVLSPATDDFAVAATERLSAFGHPVTLLSPAVAATVSLGGRHQRLDRACRLSAIRDQGTRVIDWHPDEPVQTAITRATEFVTVP